MRRPNFGTKQFLDQTVFQSGADLARTSLATILSGAFRPGVLNVAQLTVAPSNLTLTLTAAPGFAVLFGNGVFGEMAGTSDGQNNNSTILDFTSFVPGSGSTTVYVVATTQPLNENPINVVGPPPGHPDYDPTFTPYVLYNQIWDTLRIQILSSNTTIDNVAVVELFRLQLAAGQTSISGSLIDYSKRPIAVPLAYNAQNGTPQLNSTISSNTIGYTFLGQPQTGLFSTATNKLSLYSAGQENIRVGDSNIRHFIPTTTEANVGLGVGMGLNPLLYPLHVRIFSTTPPVPGTLLYLENPNISSNFPTFLTWANNIRTYTAGVGADGGWELSDFTGSNSKRLSIDIGGNTTLWGPQYIANGNNLYFIASSGLPNDAGDLVFLNSDSTERARIYNNSVGGSNAFYFTFNAAPPSFYFYGSPTTSFMSILNSTTDRGYAIDSGNGPNAIGYFRYNSNNLYINTDSASEVPWKPSVVIHGTTYMPEGAVIGGVTAGGRLKTSVTYPTAITPITIPANGIIDNVFTWSSVAVGDTIVASCRNGTSVYIIAQARIFSAGQFEIICMNLSPFPVTFSGANALVVDVTLFK